MATNVACFRKVDDFEAHETRVCIHDSMTLDDQRRVRRHTPEQWLKPQDAMVELFSDLPDAVANTIQIAKQLHGVELILGHYFLPEYPVPDSMTLDEFFKEVFPMTDSAIACTRLGLRPILDESEYRKRLDFEVDVILHFEFGLLLDRCRLYPMGQNKAIPVGMGAVQALLSSSRCVGT